MIKIHPKLIESHTIKLQLSAHSYHVLDTLSLA